MRISKLPSGGRGEYELAGSDGGLHPADLEGHVLTLRLGSHVLETGIRVELQGGKHRLRIEGGGRGHAALQVAAALLMPPPIRDEQRLPPGPPRLETRRYIMRSIELRDVVATSGTTFEATASTVSYGEDAQFSVRDRVAQVEQIWGGKAAFPDSIQDQLAVHEQAVRDGKVRTTAPLAVSAIQRDLASFADDLGIEYTEDEDALPQLLKLLGGSFVPSPEPPDPGEPPEVRVRETKRKRGLLRQRGAASAKFSRDVRRAYRHTCVVCGRRFPKTARIRSGVDGAHILPWAKFDCDSVSNGLCLCREHHWMFDEALIFVEYRGADGYWIVADAGTLTDLDEVQFSTDAIKALLGKVPDARLPRAAADRPRPEFLADLRKLLTA